MNSSDLNRQGIDTSLIGKQQMPGGSASIPEQVGKQGQSSQSKLAQGIDTTGTPSSPVTPESISEQSKVAQGVGEDLTAVTNQINVQQTLKELEPYAIKTGWDKDSIDTLMTQLSLAHPDDSGREYSFINAMLKAIQSYTPDELNRLLSTKGGKYQDIFQGDVNALTQEQLALNGLSLLSNNGIDASSLYNTGGGYRADRYISDLWKSGKSDGEIQNKVSQLAMVGFDVKPIVDPLIQQETKLVTYLKSPFADPVIKQQVYKSGLTTEQIIRNLRNVANSISDEVYSGKVIENPGDWQAIVTRGLTSGGINPYSNKLLTYGIGADLGYINLDENKAAILDKYKDVWASWDTQWGQMQIGGFSVATDDYGVPTARAQGMLKELGEDPTQSTIRTYQLGNSVGAGVGDFGGGAVSGAIAGAMKGGMSQAAAAAAVAKGDAASMAAINKATAKGAEMSESQQSYLASHPGALAGLVSTGYVSEEQALNIQSGKPANIPSSYIVPTAKDFLTPAEMNLSLAELNAAKATSDRDVVNKGVQQQKITDDKGITHDIVTKAVYNEVTGKTDMVDNWSKDASGQWHENTYISASGQPKVGIIFTPLSNGSDKEYMIVDPRYLAEGKASQYFNKPMSWGEISDAVSQGRVGLPATIEAKQKVEDNKRVDKAKSIVFKAQEDKSKSALVDNILANNTDIKGDTDFITAASQVESLNYYITDINKVPDGGTYVFNKGTPAEYSVSKEEALLSLQSAFGKFDRPVSKEVLAAESIISPIIKSVTEKADSTALSVGAIQFTDYDRKVLELKDKYTKGGVVDFVGIYNELSKIVEGARTGSITLPGTPASIRGDIGVGSPISVSLEQRQSWFSTPVEADVLYPSFKYGVSDEIGGPKGKGKGVYFKGAGDVDFGGVVGKKQVEVEYFVGEGKDGKVGNLFWREPGTKWFEGDYKYLPDQSAVTGITCRGMTCQLHEDDLNIGVKYIVDKGFDSFVKGGVTEKVSLPVVEKPVVIPPVEKIAPPANLRPQDKYIVPKENQFIQWKREFEDAVKKGVVAPMEGVFAGINEAGERIFINKNQYDRLNPSEKKAFEQKGIAGIETWAGQNEATQRVALSKLSGYVDNTSSIPSYNIVEFSQDKRNEGESVESIAQTLVTAGFNEGVVQGVVSTLPPSEYLSDKEYNALSVVDYAQYRATNPNDPRVKYGAVIFPTLESGLKGNVPAPVSWLQASRNVGVEGWIGKTSTLADSWYRDFATRQESDLAAFGKDLESKDMPLNVLLEQTKPVRDGIAKVFVTYDPILKPVGNVGLTVFSPAVKTLSDISETIKGIDKPVIKPVRNWFEKESWTTAQMEEYINKDKAEKIQMWTDGKIATGMNPTEARKFAEKQYAAGDMGKGLLTTVHLAWEAAKFLPYTAIAVADNWAELSEGNKQAIVDTVSLAGGILFVVPHGVGSLTGKVSSGRYWEAGGEVGGYVAGAIITPGAIAKAGMRGTVGLYDVVQAARGKAILPRALNFRTDVPLIEVPDVFKTIEQIGREKLDKIYAIKDVNKRQSEIRKLLNTETAKVYDNQIDVINNLVNAPVDKANYATNIVVSDIVKRLPDEIGANRVKSRLQEYGSDIVIGGSFSDNVQMEGVKGQYKANDVDIKTSKPEQWQMEKAKQLAADYGNGYMAKGRKVYAPDGEKIIEFHSMDEFPNSDLGFDSKIKNVPVKIDGIYFEDIRNQIIRRGQESIRPGLGGEGTGLMGFEVSGKPWRVNDVIRYGIISDMLLDNLRKGGKVGVADVLQRKLDTVFKSPRGEPLPSVAKGEVVATEQEFLNAIDESLRNVITAGLDVQTKVANRPVWLKSLVERGSTAVEKVLSENAELRALQQNVNQVGTESAGKAFYDALDNVLKKEGVRIYNIEEGNIGGQALPIPKSKAEEARVKQAVNLLKQESVIPTQISTITPRGTFARELTPAERSQSLTLYSVVRNGDPYIESVKQGRPVISGYVYDEQGRLVQAERPEIYFASQAAVDRAFDLYNNVKGSNPIVVAFKVTAQDLFDILEPVKRVETFKKPAKFQIIEKGGGGDYVEYKAALDEWTTKEGVPMYGLVDKNGEMVDVYTRHKRTGDKLPIMYFTSERGLEAGVLPPTPKEIRGLALPAIKGSVADLFHPQLPSELVFDKEFSAMGEQGLLDFYKKDWSFSPVSKDELARVQLRKATAIVDKSLAEIGHSKIELPKEKPKTAEELAQYNKLLKEEQTREQYLSDVNDLKGALASRNKLYGDLRFESNKIEAMRRVDDVLKKVQDKLYPGEFNEELRGRIARNLVEEAWSEYRSSFARMSLPKSKPVTISGTTKVTKLVTPEGISKGMVITTPESTPLAEESSIVTKVVTGTTDLGTTVPTTEYGTTPVTEPITTPTIRPKTIPITTPYIKPITTGITVPPTTPTKLPTEKTTPKPRQPAQIDKVKELVKRGGEGLVAWKQGFVYRVWYPPWSQTDMLVTRKPVEGVTYAKGLRSAYDSIVRRGGYIPPVLTRDMGIYTVQVRTMGDQRRPELQFRRDTKDTYKGKRKVAKMPKTRIVRF